MLCCGAASPFCFPAQATAMKASQFLISTLKEAPADKKLQAQKSAGELVQRIRRFFGL